MLKTILTATAVFSVTNAYAHVGGHDAVQHSAEHLFLGLTLVTVAWLVFPRARRALSKIRRK